MLSGTTRNLARGIYADHLVALLQLQLWTSTCPVQKLIGVQMVLDAGQLVEFDTPKNLLMRGADSGGGTGPGYLRSLVEESKDKEALYTLAGLGPDGKA